MKWPITDSTQATLAIGVCVLVFTLLQIGALYLFGRKRSDWLKRQRENAVAGIWIGLPVSGIIFLTTQGGYWLFLFAIYLLLSSWFACYMAFKLAIRNNHQR